MTSSKVVWHVSERGVEAQRPYTVSDSSVEQSANKGASLFQNAADRGRADSTDSEISTGQVALVISTELI